MGHHRPWVHRFTETVCAADCVVWIWYFTLYWEKCIICGKTSDLCAVCLCGSVLHLDRWAVCALGEGVGKRSHKKWPWHINEHGNEAPPPRSGEYHHPWGSAPCAQRAQHLQLHLQLWMRRLFIQPELVFSVFHSSEVKCVICLSLRYFPAGFTFRVTLVVWLAEEWNPVMLSKQQSVCLSLPTQHDNFWRDQ